MTAKEQAIAWAMGPPLVGGYLVLLAALTMGLYRALVARQWGEAGVCAMTLWFIAGLGVIGVMASQGRFE